MNDQVVPLGDICEFKYGKSLPAVSRNPGPYKVYGSNGQVGNHESALTSGAAVIIGRKGSFGEVHYSVDPCWPIDTTYYVDENSTKCDLKWLSWRLAGLGLKDLNRAAAIPGLSRDDAYRRKLLVPPVEEQRRIAQMLDQVDALRAKRREAIALLDDLAQSIFLDMFGDPASNPREWPLVQVGDLLESASYGTSAKASLTGTIPVLRMNNITKTGDIDMTKLKYMNADEVGDRYRVHQGDVLFNRTNSPELVGKTAIYRRSEPLAYAGYLIRARVNESTNPEYLSAFLNTKYAKRVLLGMCKSIVGMANINAKELRSIRIACTPADLQDEFAKRVISIERMKAIQRDQLKVLDQLFASAQQRAFRGELWADEAA
ncbi:restriction endonuclease subunit S [Amycolatopsis sp. NPDC051372]|uniref:restriction endonuclease subunit S n=1 Tax=Amycolatopsis sp. NPDC051372 TaxID=3155669 RepID=UPI0034277EE1